MMAPIPRILIIVGAGMVICGLVIHFYGRIPGLKHLGNLPGDIKIEGKNYQVYFPWVTSLVISLILTLLGLFFRRNQ